MIEKIMLNKNFGRFLIVSQLGSQSSDTFSSPDHCQWQRGKFGSLYFHMILNNMNINDTKQIKSKRNYMCFCDFISYIKHKKQNKITKKIKMYK